MFQSIPNAARCAASTLLTAAFVAAPLAAEPGASVFGTVPPLERAALREIHATGWGELVGTARDWQSESGASDGGRLLLAVEPAGLSGEAPLLGGIREAAGDRTDRIRLVLQSGRSDVVLERAIGSGASGRTTLSGAVDFPPASPGTPETIGVFLQTASFDTAGQNALNIAVALKLDDLSLSGGTRP